VKIMTSTSFQNTLEKYVPVVGDITHKSPLAYRMTRGIISGANAIQMAFSKAYINGIEVPDAVTRSLLNSVIPILYKYFPTLLIPYDWVVKESIKLAEGSQELMKIQYNLPTDLLRVTIGEGKLIYPKYSVALWEKGATNLAQAQMHMLNDLIEKLDIQDGDEILDLGCGWGCAANYILSRFPHAKVTGLNLSREQCNYIHQKMQEPESYLSSERFTLCEGDFNEATFEKKFDKIITIGFFEHVGNFTKSFKKMASFLKDDGRIFLHIISTRLPHNIYSPFINKYIFPYMRIWDYDAAPRCDRDLKTIDRWYLNGANYSKTLKAWLKNFDENQEKIKSLNFGLDYAKFRRIWRLYLLWCIAYFDACDGEILGNSQYLMKHA
jgi:cyclopropane-fatty-acyl-phospholipid synthase